LIHSLSTYSFECKLEYVLRRGVLFNEFSGFNIKEGFHNFTQLSLDEDNKYISSDENLLCVIEFV
jgi:hypothetical protein